MIQHEVLILIKGEKYCTSPKRLAQHPSKGKAMKLPVW